MKKILSRLFCTVLVLLLSIAPSVAQRLSTPHFYTEEDVADVTWLHAQFVYMQNYLTDTGVAANLQTAAKSAADFDKQAWMLVGTADEFYMKNRAGHYIGWNEATSRFTIVETVADTVHLSLLEGTLPGQWEISRIANKSKAMNQFGGGGIGVSIGEWNYRDPVNQIYFRKAILPEVPTLSDFFPEEGTEPSSWYVRLVNGGNKYLAAPNPESESKLLVTALQESAQSWFMQGTAEDFVMQNTDGVYVGWNGTKFTSVPTETEAVRLKLYKRPNDDYWEIQRTESTNKSFNPDEGASGEPGKNFGEYNQGDNGNRIEFIRYVPVTPRTDYPTFSATATADNPAWYYLKFDLCNICLTDKNGPQNLLMTGTMASLDLYKLTQIWQLIGNDETDFVLKGWYGVYVGWNGNRFVGTANEEEAVHFSLITNPQTDRWNLKIVGTNQVLRLAGFASNIVTQLQRGGINVQGSGFEFLPAENVALPANLPRVEYRDSWIVDKRKNETAKVGSLFVSDDKDYGHDPNEYTGEELQRTSVIQNILYMKPGNTRMTRFPTVMSGQDTKINQYQRWYDYKTGKYISPYIVSITQKYRMFSNGLVMGQPLTNSFVGGGSFNLTLPKGVKEYIVGVDVSRYRDYTYNAADSLANMIEPSLSARYLYILRDANEMAQKLMECTGDTWLEEKEITCPAKWIGFKKDAIGVQYELLNYWFYRGAAVNNPDSLQNISAPEWLEYELDDAGNSGIRNMELLAANSNGIGKGWNESRFFTFEYPEDSLVQGFGKFAYLKIYAKDKNYAGRRYNVARIKLVFLQNSEARPYTEIMGKNEDGEFRSARSPEYIKSVAGDPIASIEFTNLPTSFVNPTLPESSAGSDNIVSNLGSINRSGQEISNSYAYPLKYRMVNYAYCPSDNASVNNAPAWGEYSLVKSFRPWWHAGATDNNAPLYYPIRSYYKSVYGDSADGYTTENDRFLYIDASEQPGDIATIDFEGNLCTGTRLYCSLWMGGSNDPIGNRVPASLLLTFVGINKDSDGKEIQTRLHTFYTGQITTYGRKADGTEERPGTNGKGVWQQLAFSFIPNSTSVHYDTYRLTIENNCYGSNGGDILLDGINVYTLAPEAGVEQSSPVCENTVTIMKMTTDFASLLSSVGLQETRSEEAGDTQQVEQSAENNPQVWYCFLDADIYDNEDIVEVLPDGTSRISDEKYKQAFDKALVGSRDPADQDKYGEYAFHRAFFSTKYDNDETQPVWNFNEAMGLDRVGVFRETLEDGSRRLIFNDRITDEKIQPGHKYYVVFVPIPDGEYAEGLEACKLFNLLDDCTIRSEFVARSAGVVRVDGDMELVKDDKVTYCAGSTPTLHVALTGTGADGDFVDETRPHDWWIGSIADYNAVEGLAEALSNFRIHYPEATTLEGVTPVSGDSRGELTEAMIELLRRYTQPGLDENGELIVKPKLYLHRATLNTRLPEYKPGENADYPVTVIPIEREIDAGNVLLCYDPREILVQVNTNAPQMKDGFEGTEYKYPEYMDDVPVRIGLGQIDGVRAEAQTLKVPLRGRIPVYDSSDAMLFVVKDVYLAGTDDPLYLSRLVNRDKDGRDLGLLPVGTTTTESIGLTENSPAIAFHFNSDFTPREGYSYMLKIFFREHVQEAGITETELCDGNFLINLKVVPAYEVWTGAAGNTDWTNDRNWARADRDALHFAAGDYVENTANGTSAGFVPLGATRVLLPTQDAEGNPRAYPLLYGGVEPTDDAFPNFDPATSTFDIRYDMEVKDPAEGTVQYTCIPLQPYNCNEITFSPATELLHAQRLNYGKAWVEYELDCNRWYTLGSPLRDMFAGDWYAPSAGGRQETAHFAPITYTTALHHRFRPAVYQRSWDKGQARVYRFGDDADPNPVNVAVRADWSQVYNDVTVPYDLGGFSVKVDPAQMESTVEKTLFRFPKADTDYTYYKQDNTTDGRTGSVTRTASHRLYSDHFATAADAVLSQTLAGETGTFYLVANPFVCGLDMAKFFQQNSWLEPKYWLMTADGQKAVMKNENTDEWIAVGGSNPRRDVAPLQAFFVKAKAGEQTTTEVQFTAGMMKSFIADGLRLEVRPRRNAAAAAAGNLRITASRDGQPCGSALVAVRANADAGYDTAEDTETLLDGNTASLPAVYTLASGRALTINSVPAVAGIPLGVESDDASPVTLRFDGVDEMPRELSLYDAATGWSEPLASGSEVTVPGKTSGRYFLMSGAATPATAVAQSLNVAVSGNEVTLTAPADVLLSHVRVADTGGRLVYKNAPAASTHTFTLSKGIYIIEAVTADETVVVKVLVG